MRPLLAPLALALGLALTTGAVQAAPAADDATVRAIERVAYDYVDGQLEGDADRVARALHPDLAKRAAAPTAQDPLGLRRMSADELVDLTRQGVLVTPKEQWSRSVKVLDVYGDAAVARVETPWFVDYFHLARFGERWVIVNALWYPKPKPKPAAG